MHIQPRKRKIWLFCTNHSVRVNYTSNPMRICTRYTPPPRVLTFSNLSFLRLHSSHSLTMRPHRIQVSSSRCERLDEAEELDTSEEPLFLREPLIERMDLESASRSLGVGGEELKLNLVTEHLCFT